MAIEACSSPVWGPTECGFWAMRYHWVPPFPLNQLPLGLWAPDAPLRPVYLLVISHHPSLPR